ncbi:transcriptional regulator GcvA [Marinobacter sp. AC-23]|uniref:transcriptional regulator GcvA n=1 Tax=Marinobacter sp. AC-23 TaxID=1879031 RepID=UPI0020C84CE8|nr:transcriptional regulator GcvA [Marinobacter sp. AC-23]
MGLFSLVAPLNFYVIYATEIVVLGKAILSKHNDEKTSWYVVTLMRRLPPLNALRMFEASARKGSFVAAGDELAVTASAVSHQIRTLEEYLGVSLFSRSKRKVELTPPGEQYLVSVRHALDEIEMATHRLSASKESNVVRISVAPNFLIRWLMPRISRFREIYPDIELQISASLGLLDFNETNTDMAVYYGNGEWDDIEVYFLQRVRLVPVCSPKLLEGDYPLLVPSDLRYHTLIYVSTRKWEWDSWLQLAEAEFVTPQNSLQLSSGQLTTAAAQENLGVALADPTLTSREISSGNLVVPFDIPLDTRKAFYLVYQKYRPLTSGMKAFKEWIISEMQATDAYGVEKKESP